MSAVVGRVPELGKEWLEVAPELREFLTKLAQIVSNPDTGEADLGVAISFFMANSIMEGAGAFGGSGAPITAEYIVGLADGTLTSERVVTATSTISWDLSAGSQARVNVIPESDQIILATRIFGG